MLYTEQAVRDNVRNRNGKRVFYLSAEDRLTPAARSWLRLEHIEVCDVQEAGRQEPLPHKPEHMTHLNAQTLVPKDHPRIALRGMVDALEAELLLCQKDAGAEEKLSGALEEILAAVRNAMRCEVLEEPMPEMKLCGMSAGELRERSHHPEKYYGQPHFMPKASDDRLLLSLNRIRSMVRQCELAAYRAFQGADGIPKREDLILFWNRLSSLLWILIVQRKKETAQWN